MAYRRTKKYTAARLESMRRGKDQARMAAEVPQYPLALPDLRMRITVERFDFGHSLHVFELRKTSRVDVYFITVDGQAWKRGGLTAALEGLRKACPRVLGARQL